MADTQDKLSSGMKVALLIVFIVFVYLFMVTFLEMTESGIEHSKTIVAYLLGSVLGTFMGYYWGNSSKGKPPDETTTKTVTESSSTTDTDKDEKK